MAERINELIESVFVDTDIKTPKEISNTVFDLLTPDEYKDVLEHVLPAYVHNYMVKRRVQRPEKFDDTPVTETTFAPDDLLSDDVSDIVKTETIKKVKQRGSAKVDARRLEWQRQLQNRVSNGTIFKVFADFTVDDLIGAADSLLAQASAFEGKAKWYLELANSLQPGDTLDSLDIDPTKV